MASPALHELKWVPVPLRLGGVLRFLHKTIRRHACANWRLLE